MPDQEHKVEVNVNVDPAQVANLVAGHPATHDEQRAAEVKGQSIHYLTIDVSGLTLAELHTRLGTTEFLPSMNASLVPGDTGNEVQAQIHADLIKQNWAQIGGVAVTSGLGAEFDYSQSGGASGQVSVENEVKFNQAILTATITTDLSGSQPKVEATVGLKVSF
jgi:hypothetical protein